MEIVVLGRRVIVAVGGLVRRVLSVAVVRVGAIPVLVGFRVFLDLSPRRRTKARNDWRDPTSERLLRVFEGAPAERCEKGARLYPCVASSSW